MKQICSHTISILNESVYCCRAVVVVIALLTILFESNGSGTSLAVGAEKPEHRFVPAKDEWAASVAFSPDGQKVFAGTNAGNLWIWDLKKEGQAAQVRLTSGDLLAGSVLSLAISPDGSSALAGCADNRVRVVDLVATKVTHILKGHGNPVFSVAFSADSQRAFTGSSGSAGTTTIIQWDLKTGKSLRRYEPEQIAASLALAPDERRFLATEFTSIQEWDVKSGERLRTLKGHEYRVYGVFYSPDGKTIISGGFDSVRVWDATTGKCLRTLGEGKFDAYHFALSPDGNRILLGGVRKMYLLDLETGIELKRWEGLDARVSVAFSPDGRSVLSGEQFGPVSVWLLPEAKTSKETHPR